MDKEMEKGVQPLDAVMTRLNVTNQNIVERSTEQLTFKVVAKGRKGRRITLNAQMKILTALNTWNALFGPEPEKPFVLKDLFNYATK